MIDFDSLIIGGGPAGLAPLVAASRLGLLAKILSRGVAVVEQGPALGAGGVGRYAIASDSTADTLVNCIAASTDPLLARLRDHPAVQRVAVHGNAAVPLPLVGAMLTVLGSAFRSLLDSTPGCKALTGYTALHTRQTRNGLWRTSLCRAADGASLTIRSRQIVLATGGHQPAARLENYSAGGMNLLPHYAGKLMQSDSALTPDGLAAISRRLAAAPRKRVVVIGSSSSAMACANAVLHLRQGDNPSAVAVTVLHRRPLRIFYPSAAAALADGYTAFGPDDICPLSGFVFRFAGFRLDSRELVMGAQGIGGRAAHPRLHFQQLLPGADVTAKTILDEADVVIAALGYRPRALPIRSALGRPIPLHADAESDNPLVDDQCRILDAAGRPIPGLLGIGLATGFFARGTNGGEPSFRGQTNGIWQWQNDTGAVIARQLETPAAGTISETAMETFAQTFA